MSLDSLTLSPIGVSIVYVLQIFHSLIGGIMAKKDDFNNYQFPNASFHFTVDIEGDLVGFQEVSGLDMEAEVLEYRHGNGRPAITMKKAGMLKSSNIVCKKGVFKGDNRLIEWYKHVLEPGKDTFHAQGETWKLLISLLDYTGSTIMTWNIPNAVVVKFTGPSLKSDSSEVAVESVEFAHDGIKHAIE